MDDKASSSSSRKKSADDDVITKSNNNNNVNSAATAPASGNGKANEKAQEKKDSAKIEINEKSETLPGWTIMRPLRMRGLKKKGESGEGGDLKTMATNDTGDGPNGVGQVDVLDVRSDDGLLEGGVGGGEGQRNTGDVEASIRRGEIVEYKVYKRRWFGLAQLVLLNIVVSWDWLTFAASSTTASAFYQVSPTAINWLSTGFLFAFVLISPLVLVTLHRGGPKMSIIIASVLILVGNWIRYAGTRSGSHGNFGALMFGQILIGLAQPFVLAAPTRYSDLWFSNRGRVAATAAMSLANPFGGAVAQLVGPEIAKSSKDIPFLVLIVAIVATVASVPSFFLPAKPPTPASASAHTPKEDILPSLRVLSKSPEFFMIMIPFVFYVSLFNSFSSLINQFLQPYSYTETQAGIAGALLIVVGLVASAITSPIIDKTKSYLLAIKAQVPIIALSYLAFTFAPQARSEIAIYVILAVLGAASFSLMPVALEYVIEVTHPVSPEVTSTICWTGGQLLGGIFIIISGELREKGKTDGSDDDGSARPPANMYNALIFQTVIAMIVVPLPLALGLFGRAHGVRLRRVHSDRLAAAGGVAPVVN